MERVIIPQPEWYPSRVRSPAVRAGGLVFTSGAVGSDPKTGKLVSDDIVGQGRQALENIKGVLEAAGTSMDNVVNVILYFKNLDDRPAFNEVYRAYFTKGMPARTGLEVARLTAGVLIEIEAIATMPG